MPSYAVIGASRGIGLEFVRQLASRTDTQVFAVVRDTNSPHIQSAAAVGHENVHIIQGDIADHRSLSRAAEAVAAVTGGSLDVLIHNAARTGGGELFRRGFHHYKDLDELDEDFIDAFKTNTLGIVHSTSAFLPLLRRGTEKKIIEIDSLGGSSKFTVSAGAPDVAAYSVTKASGRLVAAKYAVGLKSEGFTVVSIHPGLVDTSATAKAPVQINFQMVAQALKEAGVQDAEVLTPAQAVEAQLRLIDSLTPEKNGAFLSYTGQVLE
ncbi:NAD-P-binding protein [Trametes cingulata]|nr:NAD-P-binding protein [Trametes cingulata]